MRLKCLSVPHSPLIPIPKGATFHLFLPMRTSDQTESSQMERLIPSSIAKFEDSFNLKHLSIKQFPIITKVSTTPLESFIIPKMKHLKLGKYTIRWNGMKNTALCLLRRCLLIDNFSWWDYFFNLTLRNASQIGEQGAWYITAPYYNAFSGISPNKD